jgi:excisionase family DNA binding protein
MERQTLTVQEAAEVLGIGKNTAYAAVGRGEIPSVRFGKKIVIPRDGIEQLLGQGTGSSPEVVFTGTDKG